MEVATTNNRLASDLARLINRYGMSARIASRKKDQVVYLKDGNKVREFLALVGAHSAVLKWEDMRILKQVREEVNRLVNCDTANLNKAIEAAQTQVSDIQLISEEVGLAGLPGALREIAQARLQAPDVSVRELGEMLSPPLSKSAAYHRVRRLSRLAESLRG